MAEQPAAQRDLLAQVQQRRELRDSGLPFPHRLGERRGAQPRSKHPLPHARPSGPEQVEERCVAVHIQVVGVRVVVGRGCAGRRW